MAKAKRKYPDEPPIRVDKPVDGGDQYALITDFDHNECSVQVNQPLTSQQLQALALHLRRISLEIEHTRFVRKHGTVKIHRGADKIGYGL